jgi:hypothetical protein
MAAEVLPPVLGVVLARRARWMSAEVGLGVWVRRVRAGVEAEACTQQT